MGHMLHALFVSLTSIIFSFVLLPLLLFSQELWNIRENLTVSLASLVRTNNPLHGTFPIPLASTVSTPSAPVTSAPTADKVNVVRFQTYCFIESRFCMCVKSKLQ